MVDEVIVGMIRTKVLLNIEVNEREIEQKVGSWPTLVNQVRKAVTSFSSYAEVGILVAVGQENFMNVLLL